MNKTSELYQYQYPGDDIILGKKGTWDLSGLLLTTAWESTIISKIF